MKLALFTDGIYPNRIGGMQKHSLKLANALAKKDVELDLYFPVDNKEELNIKPKLLSDKINLYPILHKKLNIPGHYLMEQYLESKRMSEIMLRNPPPDFIYAQGFSAWYLLAKRRKFFVALNFHGYELLQNKINIFNQVKNSLLKQYFLKNIKNADFVFSFGGQIDDLLIKNGIPESKLIDNNNCIDSSWLRTKPSKENVNTKFLFIGRNERRKGVAELFKAIQKIMDQHLFEFHFVGPIPNDIHSEKVIFHQTVNDEEKLKEIIDSCDVLVCPSYSEGMPTVILEAMARGLAIMATNVGAVAKMVSEENGWLLELSELHMLDSVLEQVINTDKLLLKNKKSNSIIKAREFTWDREVDRLLLDLQKRIKKSHSE